MAEANGNLTPGLLKMKVLYGLNNNVNLMEVDERITLHLSEHSFPNQCTTCHDNPVFVKNL